MRPTFAIASNFHLDGGWSDRLRVAENGAWRVPRDEEIAGLLAEASSGDPTVLLFAVPAHMSSRFWDMLGEEAAEGSGDFVTFAADLRQFLAFKELPPPEDFVFDLVVQDVGGAVDTEGLWALVNFGDDPLALDWPGVRLQLGPGEGCHIGRRERPAVVSPTEEPNVMVAIRQGSAEVSADRLDS